MKDMSDGTVDCFICDLPYGCLHPERKRDTTKWYDSAGQARGSCPWDVKLDLAKFWEQIKRLAKNDHTPVLMFCNTKFGYELIKSNESWFRYDLVWDKQRGVSFLSANKMPMKSHEMIYVFSKKGAFYRRVDVKTNRNAWSKTGKGADRTAVQYNIVQENEGTREGGKDGLRCPLSVIPIIGKSAGGHPTEKPEELYEWLLRRYVPGGGTVLDPTAGSFNSCFVADRLGYVALGIEMNGEFFEKAVSRLNP